MKNSKLHEEVVIITGASSGIGKELALQLAEKGAWLSLAARNTERLENLAEQCQKIGTSAISVPTDVAIQEDCKNLIEKSIQAYGKIDILINNAGIAIDSRFDDLPELDLFKRVIEVNFYGSVYCTYYALPYLKQNGGRLVAVSSQRGRFSSAKADGYGASKHAKVGFFTSLRNELINSGVSITMMYPGWVSTFYFQFDTKAVIRLLSNYCVTLLIILNPFNDIIGLGERIFDEDNRDQRQLPRRTGPYSPFAESPR